MTTWSELKKHFKACLPKVGYASLRFITDDMEWLSVRNDVLEPPCSVTEKGFMVTVINKGGSGYAASSDLSANGMKKAVQKALEWAEISRKYPLVDWSEVKMPESKGEYASTVERSWRDVAVEEKVGILKKANELMKISDFICDRVGWLQQSRREAWHYTAGGNEFYQMFEHVFPFLEVHANKNGEMLRRSNGGMVAPGQGGFESVARFGCPESARTLAEEALELLDARNCPTGTMDILIDPSQMALQVHESIGHPIEVDRILGDERNYAGTSFVKPEMFGTYQYGSKLLNIVFDPTASNERASYAFDDEGRPGTREDIIRNGLLERGLGGTISEARCSIPGVANSRTCRWMRPPIDRIGNLNMEPGTSSLEDMIKSVEKGVMVKTNISWSIDDSRNKFQFGCEWGRLIENGKLTTLVKKPGYRGISATFWRNLKMVGNKSTLIHNGINTCGKGEPNQGIWVGHTTPWALFKDVEVFGGDKK